MLCMTLLYKPNILCQGHERINTPIIVHDNNQSPTQYSQSVIGVLWLLLLCTHPSGELCAEGILETESTHTEDR